MSMEAHRAHLAEVLREREAAANAANLPVPAAPQPTLNNDDVNVWGRDTEVGKHLAKLYGQKPQISYPKPRTRRTNPASFKPWFGGDGYGKDQEKAHVNVPRVARPDYRSMMPKPVDCIPRRKTKTAIDDETEREPRREMYRPPPVKHISVADKDNLALQNQFAGAGILPKNALFPSIEPPAAMNKGKKVDRPSRAQQAALKAQEDSPSGLFNRIMSEIEERKNFLDEMTSCGKQSQYKHQIENEIRDRIKELEILDNIQKRDAIPALRAEVSGDVGVGKENSEA